MDELYNNSAFADARGHTLDGTVADVADDKNSGDIGFEQARIAVEGP